MVTKRNTFLTQYLLPFLWIGVLAAYVLAGTPLTPFHGDESTLIYMSRDYAYQFIEHDLTKIAFSETPTSPQEQNLRLINGTVIKYLIGLSWHSAGMSITDLNDQWDWGADWDYNQQNGHAPSEALLAASRWPSALLLAAGVAVMFALGDATGGKGTAYAASLFYALNPALLVNGRRAMMEGSFIFFSLLVVLAGIWLVAKPSLRRGVLLGLAAGMAVASKHTAVFTLGAVLVGAVIYLIYQSVRSQDDSSVVEYLILPSMVVAAVVAGLTFYVLNPAWWGDPLNRAKSVLELRTQLLNDQTKFFGGYTDLDARVNGFFQQVLVGKPQYFEVAGWDTFIGDQIERYETSGWRGVSVGESGFGVAILCVMIGAGLLALAQTAYRERFRNRMTAPEGETQALAPPETGYPGARWMVTWWTAVTVVTTVAVTPLEWQRYYLPVIPAVGLIAGLGVSQVAKVAWDWKNHTWPKP